MRKRSKIELAGVETAKLILAVSFIVFFGAILGVAGYLSNLPVKIKQSPVSFVPEVTALPTPIVKDGSEELINPIKPVAEDTEGKTYRNTREGNKAYKLVEIKISGDWQVTAGTNELFTQSLRAYFPENNSRLRFGFDIAYDLETDLRNTEKEFTPVILSGASETLMRREITNFDSEADREVSSIETYIRSGSYYYIFSLADMDGNKITAEYKDINDQFISTFKFIETDISDIGNLVSGLTGSPTEEIKDILPDDKNYLRDEVPSELISKILTVLNVVVSANENCKTEDDFIKSFEYGSMSLDLNGDKIKEFIIMPGGVCGELTTFRGASGNGPILIWQKTNKVWKQIGDLRGNTYLIKNSKTDKYYDIVTYSHLSYISGNVLYYQWNKAGSNYKELFSKVVEW